MTGLDDAELAALCEARAFAAGHAPGAAWAGGGSSAEQATVIDSEPVAPPTPEIEMLLDATAVARLSGRLVRGRSPGGPPER